MMSTGSQAPAKEVGAARAYVREWKCAAALQSWHDEGDGEAGGVATDAEVLAFVAKSRATHGKSKSGRGRRRKRKALATRDKECDEGDEGAYARAVAGRSVWKNIGKRAIARTGNASLIEDLRLLLADARVGPDGCKSRGVAALSEALEMMDSDGEEDDVLDGSSSDESDGEEVPDPPRRVTLDGRDLDNAYERVWEKSGCVDADVTSTDFVCVETKKGRLPMWERGKGPPMAPGAHGAFRKNPKPLSAWLGTDVLVCFQVPAGGGQSYICEGECCLNYAAHYGISGERAKVLTMMALSYGMDVHVYGLGEDAENEHGVRVRNRDRDVEANDMERLSAELLTAYNLHCAEGRRGLIRDSHRNNLRIDVHISKRASGRGMDAKTGVRIPGIYFSSKDRVNLDTLPLLQRALLLLATNSGLDPKCERASFAHKIMVDCLFPAGGMKDTLEALTGGLHEGFSVSFTFGDATFCSHFDTKNDGREGYDRTVVISHCGVTEDGVKYRCCLIGCVPPLPHAFCVHVRASLRAERLGGRTRVLTCALATCCHAAGTLAGTWGRSWRTCTSRVTRLRHVWARLVQGVHVRRTARSACVAFCRRRLWASGCSVLKSSSRASRTLQRVVRAQLHSCTASRRLCTART